MPTLHSVRLWFRALFSRRRQDGDLDREFRFHLQMEIEKYIREGDSPGEARRRALIAFGGVTQFKDTVHDERGTRPLEDCAMDLKYSIRSLRRAPAFALAAIATLALGISSTTAIFGIVKTVLLDPLSYADPGRLVFVTEATDKGEPMLTSFPNFDDWRRQTRLLSSSTAILSAGALPVMVGTDPVYAQVQLVSREFFGVFGVAPLLGRALLPDENRPGAPSVAVVGERFWRGQLGARTDLAALSVRASGELYNVVGVMPAGFRVLGDADIWMAGERQPVTLRGAGNYSIVGRLAPGASLAAARSELDRIAAGIKQQYGDKTLSTSVFIQPLLERVVGTARTPLLLLLCAAVFLLVVTCASVAMMQLSRGDAREREIAIRAALGAQRFRIVRQLVTENLVLATLGCAGGLALAYAAIGVVRRYGPAVIPRIDEVRVDLTTLGITVLVAVLSAFLFGLMPILRLLRPRSPAQQSLRTSMTGAGGNWSVLVSAQAAVAVLLVVGTALLVNSLIRIVRFDAGYNRAGVVAVHIPLFTPRYNQNNGAARLPAYERIRSDLAGIPGVQQVALINQLPSDPGVRRGPVLVPPFDDPEAPASWASTGVGWRVVTPEYFSTLGIPLLRGRLLESTDRDNSRSVVVNAALAEKLWPHADPLGKQVRALWDFRGDTLTVVGVVGNARDWHMAPGTQREMYTTVWQRPEHAASLYAVVRASGDLAGVMVAARQKLRAIDPEVPVTINTLDRILDDSIADRRFIGGLLFSFAGIVLLLTTVGVFGSVAYAVTRRTREIGVRVALGATPAQVWILVQRGVLRSALMGGMVGAAAAWLSGRVLTSQLYELTPHDPAAFTIGVVVTIIATAGAACWPALRATRIQPGIALRAE